MSRRRSPCGRARSWTLALTAIGISWLTPVIAAGAPTRQEPATPDPASGKTVVTEAGGRLVVTGETVVVEGRTSRPPSDSSVATKIDTPLLETPRSVTVIDRRMLDDQAAINLSQAHDYT